MLKPHELDLLQTAAVNFREFPTRGLSTHGAATLERLAARIGMSTTWIGLPIGRAIGYTDAGHAAIAKLARSLRRGRTAGLRRANPAVVEKAVASLLGTLLSGREPGRLAPDEVAMADERISAWFDDHDVLRTHYVPCRITPHSERPFSIGPVDFFHLKAFPKADFDGPSGFGIDEMLSFMSDHSSNWIARARIPAHEEATSEEAANLVVDVALGALSLVLPRGPYEGIGRSTGRVAPSHWPSLRVTSGRPGFGSHTREPGRTVSQGLFGRMVSAASSDLYDFKKIEIVDIHPASRLPARRRPARFPTIFGFRRK